MTLDSWFISWAEFFVLVILFACAVVAVRFGILADYSIFRRAESGKKKV